MKEDVHSGARKKKGVTTHYVLLQSKGRAKNLAQVDTISPHANTANDAF